MNKLTSLEGITKEIQIISAYLQDRYDETNGNELSARITILNSYLARSAEMLSKAQYFYDKSQGDNTDIVLKECKQSDLALSPTVIKKLVDGKCAIEAAALKYCERLNRSITHQLEGIRTQISYLKSLPN